MPNSCPSVSLRKFPYPWSCALAICSDLDGTESIEKYLTLQTFLCTNQQTKLGRGLNLEIGNSFWVFRNSDMPGLSYFEGISRRESKFAPFIRELTASGHIDVLHTYGDFNKGGFERKYAEIAAEEMRKRGMKLSTWVNHGNAENAQNVGNLPWFGGDDPASPAFHLDITRALGLRYFWQSQLTHLVGQTDAWTARNHLRNVAQRYIARKNRGRQIDPFFSNRLMETTRARDGLNLPAFMRFINPWGRRAFTDIHNLPHQIGCHVLEELIRNEGYLILYTHLGNNGRDDAWLPQASRECLENLARLHRERKIFVTTTTRLLRYFEMWENVRFTVREIAARREIDIHSGNPGGGEMQIQGLTFYCAEPEKAAIFFNGKRLETKTNSADKTGKASISIPWRRLEIPDCLAS